MRNGPSGFRSILRRVRGRSSPYSTQVSRYRLRLQPKHNSRREGMAEDGGKITELLIEHYQQTYEKTYEMWRERNRMFPTLAAVIGGGAMLAFRIPEAESLFVAL